MALKKSYLRCRESIWFCTALYPSFHDGHGYGRSVMVRPGHGLVRQFHFQGPIVPSQPVPLAGPCPSWCMPSHQHEVIRVCLHKPHLVTVHRHVGLMVESTHVAQSYVGHPIPKTSQELRMLSSVTINCQITKIVMNSGSQLSEL